MEFVLGILLKVFYSFGNIQKMFWAGVSPYSNFVDSFSKAAYYWLSWGSWGKTIAQKKLQGQKEKNSFVKQKGSYKNIQYLSQLLPCILLCKFISWTSRKTIMPNCTFFSSIKHSRDNDGRIFTTTSTEKIFEKNASFHVK